MDSIRLKWDRLFVHYSAHDQFTVVQGIREGGEAVRTKLSETMNALSAQGAAILGRMAKTFTPSGMPHTAIYLILGIGAVYGAMIFLRRSRQGTAQLGTFSSEQQAVITLYTTMLHCCAERGIAKPASTTPREFLYQVRERWAEAWPAADALTQLYTRVRFGLAPLTAEDLATAEARLRHLRTLERSTNALQQASR